MSIAIKSVVSLKKESMRISLPSDGIRIAESAFTVVVGQNGSGKTTLLEAAIGVRTDYKVERVILGDARAELADSTKRKLGVSTQIQSFADGVSVQDIIKLHAGSYQITTNDTLLDAFDLKKILDSKYAKISGGQKKRLSLYFALAHEPDLCILDEPEAGLDNQGLEAFLGHIKTRAQQGKATFAASHISKTFELADEVLLMDAGEVTFSGSKSNFITQFLDGSVLEVDMAGLSETAQSEVRAIGSTRCFEGMEDDKLLVFGHRKDLVDFIDAADGGIKNQSILRDIRASDILTWVNNRVA